MKLDSAVIFTKGMVATLVPAVSALVGSLSQWSNDSGEPTKIQWIIIIGTTVGAGAAGLGSFLSNAFGTYVQDRKGNNGIAVDNKPTPP